MNVHKRFGRVEPEDAQSPVGLVGQQQRHGAVQAEASVDGVGEGVQVVQPVRFRLSVGLISV